MIPFKCLRDIPQKNRSGNFNINHQWPEICCLWIGRLPLLAWIVNFRTHFSPIRVTSQIIQAESLPWRLLTTTSFNLDKKRMLTVGLLYLSLTVMALPTSFSKKYGLVWVGVALCRALIPVHSKRQPKLDSFFKRCEVHHQTHLTK